MRKKSVAIVLTCSIVLVVLRIVSYKIDSSEISSTKTEEKSQDSNIEEIIENFDAEYPDYELLEYVLGDEGNAPIRFAAVAREKGSEIASTLFVVDENGTGKLGLASGLQAVYRAEDGLKLDENSVRVSLDVYDETAGEWKIHDFQIIVTQEMVDERYQTKYTSMENIRS